MGVSTFICNVNDKPKLMLALRDIIRHNTTKPTKIGIFDQEERNQLDPTRSTIMKNMGLPGIEHWAEHWSRGEEIQAQTVLVRFQDELWLEVSNNGLGASTMHFLKTQGEASWMKYRSLSDPDKWTNAPAVAECHTFKQLVDEHERLTTPGV